MIRGIFILLLGIFTLLGSVESYAQKHKERRLIRAGNDLYEKGDYVESEVSYRRAIDELSESLEANYNLAGSLYKQERFKEAALIYDSIASDSMLSDEVSSQTLYNSGNSFFEQRELEKALESYKSSLRINPNDMEAKFNLAYTKKLLEEEKEQEQDDQDKDDQDDKDQDQDKDQDKDQESDDKDDDQEGDQDKDDQEGDKDENEDDQQKPEDKEGEGDPNQGEISKQDAEQMLNAVQMEEDKTREKQDAKKVKTVGKSGKNW